LSSSQEPFRIQLFEMIIESCIHYNL
jgi:hypothetical protein